MRSLAARYDSKSACRSRWSGSRLRRTATSQRNSCTSSSAKLETSQTIHVPGSTESATSLSGVCSLPARTAGPRRGVEHRSEEPHRGRLSLRPRHAEDRVPGKQPPAELELAPDRDIPRASSRDGRRLARHPGALHDDVDVLQQILLLGPEHDFDTRLGKPPGIRVGPPVGRPHRPASRREGERRGPAGEPQTDDEGPVAAHYFLWNSSGWKSKKYW